MFPIATKKGGQAIAFPDVCKTPGAPPIPLPYPNIGMVQNTDETVKTVLAENKEVVVESSKVPSSMGDEAGVLKGVVSNTHRGEIKFKKYSSKVYAKGKKVVYHTAVTQHNGSNANAPVGCHGVPSQTKVLAAP